MKLPRDRSPRNDGFYGGFGSRHAPQVWTPHVSSADEPRERVPKRFRRLRLRRRRSARREGVRDGIPDPVVFAMVLVIALMGLAVLAVLLS
jgi:hypothetical protein